MLKTGKPARIAQLSVIVLLFSCAAMILTAKGIGTSQLKFQAMLRYPIYRNTIFPGQKKIVDIGVSVVGTQANVLANLTIQAEIAGPGNGVKLEQSVPYNPTIPLNDIVFDLTDTPPGSYTVTVKLVNNGSGNTLNETVIDLTVASKDASMPRIYIDEYNRTVKEGQPFFPLGFYTSRFDPATMDKVLLTGFNSMMAYGLPSASASQIDSALKYAADHNLNVIFSVKDTYNGTKYAQKQWTDPQGTLHSGGFDIMKGLVNSFKDKDKYPALLAWYMNDELDTPYIDQIQERYDWIVQNDYDHPVWQVLYKGQNLQAHVANTDILGLDNYPIWSKRGTNKAPSYIDFTQATLAGRKATMSSRAIWMAPECKVENGSRPDTYEEMVNYAYQALINGARGLVYYNLDNLLSDQDYKDQADQSLQTMKRVGDQINAIMPIALGIDAMHPWTVSSGDSRIEVLTRVVGNAYYVIAVNPYNETIDTSLIFWEGNAIKQLTVGLPGNPGRIIQPVNGQFPDEFGPLATRVYKID